MSLRRAPLLLLLCLSACTGARTDLDGLPVTSSANRAAARLAGTWELVSTRITRGDSVVLDARAPEIQALKILNDTHYSVITRRGEQFMRAGAGRYSLSGDTYTETLDLGSGQYTPGGTYTFRIRLDGDTWTTDGGTEVTRFHEVWRRVR